MPYLILVKLQLFFHRRLLRDLTIKKSIDNSVDFNC